MEGTNMENLEYEVKYQNLNVYQLINNRKQFDYEVIQAYITKYSNGFKVKDVGKTHRSGTIYIFEKIYDAEESKQYNKIVIELIEKYNSQYGTQVILEDFIENI
jgi:methanogenic corrinoid protein MtbC1